MADKLSKSAKPAREKIPIRFGGYNGPAPASVERPTKLPAPPQGKPSQEKK